MRKLVNVRVSVAAVAVLFAACSEPLTTESKLDPPQFGDVGNFCPPCRELEGDEWDDVFSVINTLLQDEQQYCNDVGNTLWRLLETGWVRVYQNYDVQGDPSLWGTYDPFSGASIGEKNWNQHDNPWGYSEMGNSVVHEGIHAHEQHSYTDEFREEQAEFGAAVCGFPTNMQ